MLDSDIAVLRPAERSESLPKRNDAGHYFRIVLGVWMQERDAPHPLGLLRARREGPCRGCAAKQCDELASSHELPSDEAHNLAHHRTMRAPVHRSEIFPLMSVQGQDRQNSQ